MESNAMEEAAKKRCREAMEIIENLTKINQQSKTSLLKLAQSELSFLSRYSSSSSPSSPLSFNIGHLEAVLHLLQQPFITGVSRVCKPLPILPQSKSNSSSLYVDIACTLNANPAWIIVSDRNPHYLHWETTLNHKHKGLKARVHQLLTAAHSASTLKPSFLLLFFSSGLTDFIRHKLNHEFGAFEFGMDLSDHFNLEETEWVNVLVSRSFHDSCALQINVVDCNKDATASEIVPDFNADSGEIHSADDAFSRLLSTMNQLASMSFQNVKASRTNRFSNLINFDTTSLIALVSGITNGGVDKLLATPESQLRARFKGNYDFVIEQVMSEIQNPMLEKIAGAINGKRGIICESVYAEFKELVSLCGGPNEKLRAEQLLTCLTVVQDTPSDRTMALPTTRKLAMKNKIVFGTGDYWHAPTLTANMSFVRAVLQTGMSLFTIEHRPRALTGD